jgi:hypothetical protein
MATNKSKNNMALGLHVLVYTATLAMLFLPFVLFYDIFILLTWLSVNAVLHFSVDYVTSRISSSLWKAEDYHNFFVVVGFDQLIHYACLFGTFKVFFL